MAPAETADARVNSDLRTGRVLCPAYYDALGQRPQPIDRVIIAPHLEPRAAHREVKLIVWFRFQLRTPVTAATA